MPESFIVGQAFWGTIPYPDGVVPEYVRPYLVVGVDDEYIEILTASSVAGKEWKATLATNMLLENFDPPFIKRTFIKLDSLQRIPISSLGNVSLCRGGRILNSEELTRIIDSIIR